MSRAGSHPREVGICAMIETPVPKPRKGTGMKRFAPWLQTTWMVSVLRPAAASASSESHGN